ncbi:hypothetical protein, partial [Arenicella sp. 4NH20-0111]|uniref:hypothetical protein n=1 Tax=Arenicella sp. 4NH20-0111 TaxID=3127648 RepID=UPI0033413A6A
CMSVTYFITDECPLACGEVPVYSSLSDKRLFGHCYACGVSFLSKDEIEDFNLDHPLEELAPKGLRLAVESDFKGNYDEWVSHKSKTHWTEIETVKELNEEIFKNT